MTRKEKIDYIDAYCEKSFWSNVDDQGTPGNCEGCAFNKDGTWCHTDGKVLEYMSEFELDQAIALIPDVPVTPVTVTDDTNTVNHPSHYNANGAMECIDEMLLIFGTEAVMNFCLCNAWKYRYRANAKNGQEDLDKANWYIAKYKELAEGIRYEATV